MHVHTNLRKFKVDRKFKYFGCIWPVWSWDFKTDSMSQEQMDRMNSFFACWWKFRKALSYFTDFWVGVVKRGHLFNSQNTKICCILRMSVWIELIFCILTVMQHFLLDQHRTLYLWLLNASLLQLYLLDPQR